MTTPPNLAGIIDAAAVEDPDRPALVFDEDPPCSYGALRDEMFRWVGTLAAAGVGPGDRIALVDWGGVRAAAATLAAAHLGAAAAQMNPLLTTGELRQLVEASGCVPVGVAGREAAASLTEALGPSGVVLEHAPPDTGESTRAAAPREPTPGGDDEAFVLFTSGTTGLPKAVPIGHAAVLARLSAYRPPFAADRPANVSLMTVPSFHVGGLVGLLLSLYGGDTTVVMPRFEAGRWLALVERERVASVFLVPTMLARLLDHPDVGRTDLSSLTVVSYGAAAAPVELIRRAMEQWPGVAFANVFGQTETLGAYTTLSPADHHDPHRAGSVGRPLPGVDVRIVEPDAGADVAAGEVGEIWVRSDQNVGPDVGTDGWLHTGDLARQDADGYVYPAGRRSDVINRGGEKFPPSEVADVLRAHPAVADLVVVGLPDAEMGERVGAAIVVRPGSEEPTLEQLRVWCEGRLAPFKRPEVVVVVDVLPVNELGKLPKRVAVELILRFLSPGMTGSGHAR